MTSTQTRPALNGVYVPSLFATLNAVKAQPENAQFQFRARNEWISGTHNRSTIRGFNGAGMEDGSRQSPVTDHPGVLVGNGPTAVEFLLHAIAGLPDVRSREHRRSPRHHPAPGAVHCRGRYRSDGHLGLSDSVRNGYRQIRVGFVIEGRCECGATRRAGRAVLPAVRGLRRAGPRQRGGRTDRRDVG